MLKQGFIGAMNSTAKRLNMQDTRFCNPHGLADKGNRSTASDLCRLAYMAMKLPLFREIVRKKVYSTKDVFDANGETTLFQWRNSNKMLHESEGFRGIKTGITTTAGPCLCCYFVHENRAVIVTLLCSSSVEHRWREMQKICTWATSNVDTSPAPASPSKGRM